MMLTYYSLTTFVETSFYIDLWIYWNVYYKNETRNILMIKIYPISMICLSKIIDEYIYQNFDKYPIVNIYQNSDVCFMSSFILLSGIIV